MFLRFVNAKNYLYNIYLSIPSKIGIPLNDLPHNISEAMNYGLVGLGEYVAYALHEKN